jgi:ClpP class serine protease
VAEFRKSGKKVYAHGKNFNQVQYHLAAQADEVFVSPDGYVFLSGFGRFPTYFKGLFDQVGVKMQIFRVGTYKSFVEPYTRSDMSPEDREATRDYLDAAWQAYQADILAARPKAAPHLARYVGDTPALLAESGGDAARMALTAGLVDGLKTADEWRDYLKTTLGAGDEGKGYKHVDMGTYIARVREERSPPDDKVGVVVAQGAIVDGEQPPGVAGRRHGGGADPPGPRGQRHQGCCAAGGQPGRQRHRLRGDPARAGTDPPGGQAGDRVDGFGGGFRRLLDQHGRRRGVGRPAAPSPDPSASLRCCPTCRAP